MTITLELSSVKPGPVKPPRKWSNRLQKFEDLDPRATFLNRLHDRKIDSQNRCYSQSLVPLRFSVPTAAAYHKNYIEYLEKCWNDHCGIVITPDIVWFMLLNEVAGLVRTDPERFRPLFSEMQEKQQIIIITEELVEMPLHALISSLKKLVPSNTAAFLPEFSTSTERSRHAFHAAFCDLVSPYYEYSMCLCAIPAIQVRGTAEDWAKLMACWQEVVGLLEPLSDRMSWFTRVLGALRSCYLQREDAAWWREMFRIEKCGSGSEVEISGWIVDLFREKAEILKLAKPENFPANVAQVNYRQLNLEIDYLMQDGLFVSQQEGDFLVPDFAYAIHQKLERPLIESYAAYQYEEAQQLLAARIAALAPAQV